MSSLPKPHFTPEAYLERERQAPYKSEYIGGEIFAMSGASREHNLITSNINRELSTQLRGRPCETYASDMRVQTGPRGQFFYPDVVAVCGEPRFRDEQVDTLLNPTVIVEVLSRSTEAFDRGEKFIYYRRLDSLQEYLLVSQESYRIEHFVRQPDGQWLLSEAAGSEATVSLPSIGGTLALADVYEKVGLPPEQPEEAS